MRIISLAAGVVLAMTATTAVLAQPAAPAPAAAASGHYSTATTPIGTLLDDPAAKAVLVKYIAPLVNNPQIDQAREMTLKDAQQYAADILTADTLGKIDADLAKLPAHK